MAANVGPVLRKARNRRRIELAEVEAATRIRIGFLRAIENEEWQTLPGGVYTRAFIRTYADFLGLDGESLVDDYRQKVEGAAGERDPGAEPVPVIVPVAARSSGRRGSPPRLAWLALPALLLAAAIALPALFGGEDDGGEASRPSSRTAIPDGEAQRPAKATRPASGVAVRLSALAEVWVCLLDAEGRPLVDGQILEGGAEEGPFRSGSFTVSLGNGEVSMLIDGRQAEIPITPSPLGYAIDSSGRLTELSDSERPTCA
jgi:cytoskeleton protein RodZ